MRDFRKRRLKKTNYGCAVEAAFDVIGNKWKGAILYHLLDGKKRFYELRRLMPGITQGVLTLQLRELESDEVIKRKIYAEIPSNIEYSLTEFGMELKTVILLLREWGLEILEEIESVK